MGGDHKSFYRDISTLMERLGRDMSDEGMRNLKSLSRRLKSLNKKGLAKINHSVMELICAKYLIERGYEVKVEKKLDPLLVCDIYGRKGDGVLIVEVETGFTPPEHALDPYTYNRARIVSKIARYSKFSDKFALATPMYNLLQIPKSLVKPPKSRSMEEVRELKGLCDLYYRHPPISLEELFNARLHAIYIIDVDGLRVVGLDPERYVEEVEGLVYLKMLGR